MTPELATFRLLADVSEQRFDVPEMAGLPEGWLRLFGMAVLITLCATVVWLYRREARAGASLGLRMTLAALRCAVILLLAVIWLEPVVATYIERTTRATVAVLVDASASMQITDPPGSAAAAPAPRAGQVEALLSESRHAWLQRLADRNELALYAFGGSPRRIENPLRAQTGQPPAPPPSTQPGAAAPPETQPLSEALRSGDPRTNLGLAFQTLLADVGDSPLASVIVITDGELNDGLSVSDVAARARQIGSTVHTVGVGSPVEPPNLRVTGLSAPATAPKGDPLEVEVSLAAGGVESTLAEVELTARRVDGAAEGEPEVLATREVRLGAESTSRTLQFTVDADQAGEFVYQARVAPLNDEAVTFDNDRTASVVVLDQRIRVLIVSGRPSFDYRYVARLLERDQTIDVSCWLQSADAGAVRDGNTVIDELPRKAEELFAYDVIILMDPNPAEFDSAWALSGRRFVDEFAGGLLLQAGQHYTSRFLSDPRLTELTRILPVVPDPDAEVRLSERGAFSTRAFPIALPADARTHPILSFASDPELNEKIWQALPGVWWRQPVLREKPIATVLLRNGAERNRYGEGVLMATQPFGAGRTSFLAFDSTWRWRGPAEAYFNQFWIQLVRYLGYARRQGAQTRGTITVDRESVEVGEFVKVEARVLDEQFVPWQAPSVEAEVEFSDGSQHELDLSASPDREGWFAGRTVMPVAGTAVIRVPLPQTEPVREDETTDSPPTLVRYLQVERPDVELRTLRLKAPDLEYLASETNGQYRPIAKASEIPDLIADRTRVERVRGPIHPLWDEWWVLVLIAGLLCVEWILRRRNHLL